MATLPWVRVGWDVRVKLRDGLVVHGRVSRVDDVNAEWFSVKHASCGATIRYSDVAGIRVVETVEVA